MTPPATDPGVLVDPVSGRSFRNATASGEPLWVDSLSAQPVQAPRKKRGIGLLLPGDLIFVGGADGTMDASRHLGLGVGDGLIEPPPRRATIKISKITTWMPIAAVRRVVTSGSAAR